MLDTAGSKLKEAKNKLEQIYNADANTVNMIKQLTKSIDDVSTQLKEQQDWLKLYFKKSKIGRNFMFYKVTWFGVPVK